MLPKGSGTGRFYIDSGTEGGEESCAKYSLEIAEVMKAHGLKVETFIDQGASHSETYWGKRFSHPITFLYPTAQTLAMI